MSRRLVPLLISVTGLIWPAWAAAAPEPIPVIEIARGSGYGNVASHVSPGGSQMVTWTAQGATPGVRLAERGNVGGVFPEATNLSLTPNGEEVSISFTPDGGLYAVWGISSGGASAQQVIRPPGGDFSAVAEVPGCHRFVDSAAGPNGEIAMACRYVLATNPPDTVRWGTSGALGLVTPSEDLLPPAYSSFLRPLIAWGSEGTVAVASEGYTTTTLPPPANQTTRIRVSLRSNTLSSSADVATATWPDGASVGRPVVLGDGTVAVPLSGTAGARVLTRPPGQLTSFAPHTLSGNGIWGLAADSSQNLHVLSGTSDEREYWTAVAAPSGGFGPPTKVPLPVLPNNGDAYVVGFEVAGDGTEFVIIRGDDGVYATSRSPGQTFLTPKKLGAAPALNPESSLTPQGDLVATWTRDVGGGEYAVDFGGLDRTPPSVTIGEFPSEAKEGEPVSFSASATDAMGIESSIWQFGSRKVTTPDAIHIFNRPGRHPVTFTATDVAGQKTVERRIVTVPIGPESKPVVSLKAPKKLRFKALRKRGVRVKVTVRPKARVRIGLGTSKRNTRIRPMQVKVVKKFRNRHVIRIKPRRAKLGKPRKFRLFVQATATTALGKRTTKARTVRIRR